MNNNKILLIIVAFFLPPLAVFLKNGNKLNGDVWLNVILTIIGGIPGIIHALYMILK
jgi:uncharacterized membrane protein YqaE (UPF0057 family)